MNNSFQLIDSLIRKEIFSKTMFQLIKHNQNINILGLGVEKGMKRGLNGELLTGRNFYCESFKIRPKLQFNEYLINYTPENSNLQLKSGLGPKTCDMHYNSINGMFLDSNNILYNIYDVLLGVTSSNDTIENMLNDQIYTFFSNLLPGPTTY